MVGLQSGSRLRNDYLINSIIYLVKFDSRSFSRVNKCLEFFRSVLGCALSLGFLVGLVDDEALQDGVHGDAVDGHEEHAYCEGDDEDELDRRESTARR